MSFLEDPVNSQYCTHGRLQSDVQYQPTEYTTYEPFQLTLRYLYKFIRSVTTLKEHFMPEIA